MGIWTPGRFFDQHDIQRANGSQAFDSFFFFTKLKDELPVCIQYFRMTVMRFDFTIEPVPGKPLFPANSLSRSLQEDKAHDPKPWNDIHTEVECCVNAVLVTLPASDQRLDEIRAELNNYQNDSCFDEYLCRCIGDVPLPCFHFFQFLRTFDAAYLK